MTTNTWILAKGRWRLIGDRELLIWVLSGFVVFWLSGFCFGISYVDRLIDRKLAPVKAEIAKIEREIAVMKKWGGR